MCTYFLKTANRLREKKRKTSKRSFKKWYGLLCYVLDLCYRY